MRDVVITLAILGALPLCLKRPWLGILMWSWIGYMNPHRLAWGFARSLPFALLVAAAVFTGILLIRDKERRPVPWQRETWLLLALWGIYTATTIAALYPAEAWPQWSKVSKVLLFTFLTMMYFQSRERLRVLFLVIALSLGFYGLKSTPFVFLTAGSYRVEGPTATFIGGNTGLGLALDMVLPFIYYLAREEQHRWLRRLLWTTFGCTILATVFTYSRGALLGLCVVLVMLLARARRRIVAFAVLGVLALGLVVIAPDKWLGRMETIQNYEEDNSAISRLVSWRVALKLAIEHPLTGGGFWALPHEEIYQRYEPDEEKAARVPHSAHSIYFSVLGDHGFPGLLVFLALLLSCFLSLRSLRRRVRSNPEAQWLVDYCSMLEVSLLAYAVSGAFLTQAYFDLFYHLVSFVVLLRVIAQTEGLVPAPSRAVPLERATPGVVTAG